MLVQGVKRLLNTSIRFYFVFTRTIEVWLWHTRSCSSLCSREEKNWYILFFCDGSTVQFELSFFPFLYSMSRLDTYARVRALPAEMRVCTFNCSLVSCYWPRDCILSRQWISLTYISLFEHDQCYNTKREREKCCHHSSLLIRLESTILVRWIR
jgi:hypothetical protein